MKSKIEVSKTYWFGIDSNELFLIQQLMSGIQREQIVEAAKRVAGPITKDQDALLEVWSNFKANHMGHL